jgi:glutathione S-transferase
MKVRMCLADKGIPYRSTIVELTAFEHLRPAYLAINPAGLVPSLEDAGRVVTESSIINEYLEDVAPSGLRPDDPLQRARMRAWTKFQDDEVHPSVRPATFQLMIRRRLAALSPTQIEALVASHPLPQRAAAFREWATGSIDYPALLEAVARLARNNARLEQTLAHSRWRAGETFSLADIALASFVDRIEHLGLSFLWNELAGVRRWVDALQARASYSAALPLESARLPAPADDALAELRKRLAA